MLHGGEISKNGDFREEEVRNGVVASTYKSIVGTIFRN